MGTNSSGKTGREGGEQVWPSTSETKCMELHRGTEEEVRESLWVRVKGTARYSDIIVGGSDTGHLAKKTEWMRPSINR